MKFDESGMFIIQSNFDNSSQPEDFKIDAYCDAEDQENS